MSPNTRPLSPRSIHTAGEGGPSLQGWVGEGLSVATTALTRLAPLGTLSRSAGEGRMSSQIEICKICR